MSNMFMRTNINSINAHRNIKNTGLKQRQASDRLSSGYRINSAADDAAGLAISETMRAQIRGLNQAERNSADGLGLLRTADGAMQEIQNMIHRMRELAVQSANDTNTQINRKQLDMEFQHLKQEIDRIVRDTEVNGVFPLRGYEIGEVINTFWEGTPLVNRIPEIPIYNGPNVTIADPPPPNCPTLPPCPPFPNLPTVNIPNTGNQTPIITNSTIDLSSGGSYRITNTDLAALPQPITVTGAGTLLIDGDIANMTINVENGASVRVNNNILSGGILNIENGSYAQIAGNVAGTVNNHGDTLISGNVTGSVTNSNNITITQTSLGATVTNTSNAIILGGNGPTITNIGPGFVEVRSNGFTVNSNTGIINLVGNNGTVINNNGFICIEGNGVHVQTNNGDLRIVGQGATVGVNNGTIYAPVHIGLNSNSGSAHIIGNNVYIPINTGCLFIDGNDAIIGNNIGNALIVGNGANINTNSGQLKVEGNGTTLGTNTGSGVAFLDGDNARVTTNNGILRIEGYDARVITNSGHLYIVGNLAFINLNTTSGRAWVIGNDTQVDTNNGLEPGGLRIDGHRTTLVPYTIGTNNGFARINGDNALVITNTRTGTLPARPPAPISQHIARLHVFGEDLRLINNHGSVIAHGYRTVIESNLSGSQADIIGTARFINDNLGIVGVGANNYSADVVFDGVNRNQIDVRANSVVSQLSENMETGTILVLSGGRMTDNTLLNHGIIHIQDGGDVVLDTNHNIIISQGIVKMDINKHYLEVGIWRNDRDTPAIGSSAGMGSFVDNNDGGIIRNFSAWLDVNTTTHAILPNPILGITMGGVIENYGSINPNLPQPPIPVNIEPNTLDKETRETLVRHHARQIDVSGIQKEPTVTNVITFWVNGGGGGTSGIPWNQPFVDSGKWETHADGGGRRTLHFNQELQNPAKYWLYDGWIIFDADPVLEIDGIPYDIQKRLDIAGSVGTSGRWLIFELPLRFMLQVGANSNQNMFLDFKSIFTRHLSRDAQFVTLSETNILTRLDATKALDSTTQAIIEVSNYRAELGAVHNRLEHIIRSLSVSSENLSDAESRVRNADMAREMMDYVQMNILFEAGMAMLTQANQNPNMVLQLLQT